MKQYKIDILPIAINDIASIRTDIINSKIALRFSRANKYVIAYYVDDENGIIKIYGIFHSHRDILKIIERRM